MDGVRRVGHGGGNNSYSMYAPLYDATIASLSCCQRRRIFRATFSALQDEVEERTPTDEVDCVSAVVVKDGLEDIYDGGLGPVVRMKSKGGGCRGLAYMKARQPSLLQETPSEASHQLLVSFGDLSTQLDPSLEGLSAR
ncbi:hypothetical protein D1007_01019 [Hordeum vulgare]|nr:hypothetical protein D1007_01019 [Hordeum vulgare]